MSIGQGVAQFTAPERRGYSVDETAKIIGCGRVTVYELIKQGRLRRVKVGARTIIPMSEIEKLLNGDDNRTA